MSRIKFSIKLCVSRVTVTKLSWRGMVGFGIGFVLIKEAVTDLGFIQKMFLFVPI